MILLRRRYVFIYGCEHPVMCLTAIISMGTTAIVSTIEGVTATYLRARHIIVHGRHRAILHHSLLPSLDFFLEFI
jgi:hypothetical protein